ncbi:MAG TPA: hypothetical protein VM869_01310 [Enhygromyxa sp.]|nr:hypothetical protein [Enhygromyxa sp.]
MHSRRGFVTLSMGAGLLGCGLVSSAGCDKTTSEAEPEPKPEPRAEPPSSAPPPPPILSAVDRYEPRLDRIHSASAYETLVSKSVAFELARQQTREATVEARQDIVELDALDNDHYQRTGELVLLGERDGWVIGFCYRYLVDFTFPIKGKDGFGEAEYSDPTLTIGEQSFPLARTESERGPDRSAGDIAWFRTFGEHDAALVYFPGTVERHLGIADPLAIVQHTLDNRSSMFGLEFVLMSPTSLTFMRERAERENNLAYFAAGMAVAALILVPLLGSSSAAVLPMASLETAGRQLVAAALPVALQLGRDFLLREDGFIAKRLDEDTRVALLGVELPPIASDGHGMVTKFLAEVVSEQDQPGQFVGFGAKQGVERGQLFLPDRKLNLSAELLSRGLVRLAMDDQAVLREFPELVTAALSAVESNESLAKGWAEDAEYVTQLRTLNKVLAG